MKQVFVAWLLLLGAVRALAQPSPPAAQQPIAVPPDVLQRISIYLQEGGSRNEGYALNKAILDAIAIEKAGKDRETLQAQRDALQAQIDAAKAKPPAEPSK